MKSKRKTNFKINPPQDTSQKNYSKSEEETLSVEDTNTLRISLGLKPLDTSSSELKSKGLTDHKSLIFPKHEKSVISSETFSEKETKKNSENSFLWSTTAYKSLYEEDEDDLNPVNWVLKQRKKDSENKLLAQQTNHIGKSTEDSSRVMSNFQNQDFGVVYSDSEVEGEDEGLTDFNDKNTKNIDFSNKVIKKSTSGKNILTNNFNKIEDDYNKISTQITNNNKNLTKMHVAHDLTDLSEGHQIVLTLSDIPLLDETGELKDNEEDVLENIELQESYRREKYLKDKQKTTVYDPTQEQEQEGYIDPDTGRWKLKDKNILSHYDEWAETAKPKPLRKGFDLKINPVEENYQNIMQSDFEQQKPFSNLNDINTIPEVMNDIQHQNIKQETPTFKKSKYKKKKIKQNIQPTSWDDIFSNNAQDQQYETDEISHTNHHSRTKSLSENSKNNIQTLTHVITPEVTTQTLPPQKTSTQNDVDDDNEFYELLSRQKRNFVQINQTKNEPIEDVSIKKEPDFADQKVDIKKEEDDSGLCLTNTTEFCRSVQTPLEKLQSLKSELYTGSALFRQQHLKKQNKMEDPKKSKNEIFDKKMQKNEENDENDDEISDMDHSDDEWPTQQQNDNENDENFDLDNDEIDFLHEKKIDGSLSSAINFLKHKGDLFDDKWRRDRSNPDSIPLHMSTDPSDIKLDYKDQYGRVMTPKEAFQLISWIFHGKGPGKAKMQSKLKKMELERKLKDNPLEALPTLKALEFQQKSSKTAHLVLSGNSQI